MKARKNNAYGWFDINWANCNKNVSQMQNDIVVAYKAGDLSKVKQLQHNLVNSFAARAVAVRKVAVINKGKNTPGVDKIAKLEPAERFQLVEDLLNHRNVVPKPVCRVWLSKDGTPIKPDQSNARPLGIPCMYDRAAQALWALALNPVAECWGDRSYGYRPYRSAHDAVAALYLKLGTRYRPNWVLEADIKGFFDNITHQWIMENIPMDKKVLKGWLKAGYIDQHKSYETEAGVPQGGVISPIIANMVLDGLTEHVAKAVGPFKRGKSPQVITVRYADDFVITCVDKETIEQVIQPAVNEFLTVRGLWLSPTKTVITNLNDGFDFLGFNFRIYPRAKHPTGFGLLVKPSAKKVQRMKDKIKGIFKEMRQASAYTLIIKLNPILRGWGTYYRHVVSKRIFTQMDHFIWDKCLKWGVRKFRKVNTRSIMSLIYRPSQGRKWVFFGRLGEAEIQIFVLANLAIKRHMIVSDLNPFLLENAEYFYKRQAKSGISQWDKTRGELLKKCNSVCAVCGQLIEPGDALEMHHIVPKSKKGSNLKHNLMALHRECHRQVTYTKDPMLKARFVELGIIAKES